MPDITVRPSSAMASICVYKPSGQLVLSVDGSQKLRVQTLKQLAAPGFPRFRLRLQDAGSCSCLDLDDDAAVAGPADLQLVMVPWKESSQADIVALVDASRHGNVTRLVELLRAPLNPNCHYMTEIYEEIVMVTPLRMALLEGHQEVVSVVSLLLEAQADPNLEFGAVGMETTALCLAAQLGNHFIVEMLLNHNADAAQPGYTDNRFESPIALASRGGHDRTVQVLLAAGACPRGLRLSATGSDRHGQVPAALPEGWAPPTFGWQAESAQGGEGAEAQQILAASAGGAAGEQGIMHAEAQQSPGLRVLAASAGGAAGEQGPSAIGQQGGEGAEAQQSQASSSSSR
ncbi:unnamed protein product [Symbiodinium sp. CCMP2592]|nr:unnamed protein product [Symbiodinium sp. CCMP2592]